MERAAPRPRLRERAAVNVVTAAGELIDADETTNSDVLWAVRGSGSGFFGVVTRYTIRGLRAAEGDLPERLRLPAGAARRGAPIRDGGRRPASGERRVRAARHHAEAAGGRLRRGRHRARSSRQRRSARRRRRHAPGSRRWTTAPCSTRALVREVAVATEMDELYAGADALEPAGWCYAPDNMWTNAGPDELIPAVRELFTTVPNDESHVFWWPWRARGAARHGLLRAGQASTSPRSPPGRRRRETSAVRTWGVDQMRRLEPFSEGIQLADENLLARPHARYLSEENSARLEALARDLGPRRALPRLPERRRMTETRTLEDGQRLAAAAAREGDPPGRRGRPRGRARGDRRPRRARPRVLDERVGRGCGAIRRERGSRDRPGRRARGVARRVPLRLPRAVPDAQPPPEARVVRPYPRLLRPRARPRRPAAAGRHRAVRGPRGRRRPGRLLHRTAGRSRAAACRDGVGRDRHLEGGDAQPRRVLPRARLRDAARRHARDRPVARAREPATPSASGRRCSTGSRRRTTSTAPGSRRSAPRSAATGR